MADASHDLQPVPALVADYGFSLFNIALAGFLLWLRPRDRTARLLAFALVGTAAVFNLQAQASFEALTLTPGEAWITAGIQVIAGLAYVGALLSFPDGRSVPHWRPAGQALIYIPVTVAATWLSLRAEGAARPGVLILFFGLLAPAAGVAAQAWRFGRSRNPQEHQQARMLFWALLPALAVGLVYLFTRGFSAATSENLAGRGLGEIPTVDFRIFQPVFGLIPIALLLGLLRFGLWDIDRIINRTLVYGATSVALGFGSLGVVILLERVFQPFTSGNDFAVVLTTLALASAFRPVRGRIQSFVDRRFYRRRYNAVRTLETFGDRLRDQIELDTMIGELQGVVMQTMQPARVGLWLAHGQGVVGESAD